MRREVDRWRWILEGLDKDNLRRRMRTLAGMQGARVSLDGHEVLNFSSNNYLGLADHPDLVSASMATMRVAGLGSGASRLIVGNHEEHERLEAELAAFHGCESALIFNSGYNANIGILQALTDARDVVFSDRLNHASIIDGCRLSRAEVVVYPHCDRKAVRALMKRFPARQKFVVTDSVFSMDGDRAPLADLSAICQEAGAVLMVDEAHATGVLGPGGRGLAAEMGVEPEVRVGTLGKAFGTFGAYVAGSRSLTDLLLNRARSFVFTTALPPSLVAATRAALRLIDGEEGEARRERLRGLVTRMGSGLREMGLLAPGAGTTAVFPIMVGDEQRVMQVCERLLARGLFVQGIRPPTVPAGTSRLRLTLMATHAERDVERLLTGLTEMRSLGLL